MATAIELATIKFDSEKTANTLSRKQTEYFVGKNTWTPAEELALMTAQTHALKAAQDLQTMLKAQN